MKVWKVAFNVRAAKELKKLTRHDQDRVLRFLRERLATTEDPRRVGHALTAAHSGLWTYRVGNLRVIADIQDSDIRILVVRIGDRREVYR